MSLKSSVSEQAKVKAKTILESIADSVLEEYADSLDAMPLRDLLQIAVCEGYQWALRETKEILS